MIQNKDPQSTSTMIKEKNHVNSMLKLKENTHTAFRFWLNLELELMLKETWKKSPPQVIWCSIYS